MYLKGTTFWDTALNDLIRSDLGQHRADQDCWKLPKPMLSRARLSVPTQE